ncbi:MAG: hypothetical protein R2704_08590 [Microthrixaceae bacterium]
MIGGEASIRGFRAADREAVLALVETHRYAPMRCYRRYGHDLGGAGSRSKLEAALDDPGLVGVVATNGNANDDSVVGFVGARPNPWESQHFGVAMGRTTELLTHPSLDRRSLAGALFGRLGHEAEAAGLAMLITSVDGEDLDGLNGALGAGHEYCEASLVYVNDTDQGPANLHRSHPFEVSAHTPAEVAALPDGSLDRVRAAALVAVRHDHFHADRRLDDERCDRLYSHWLEQAIAGEWADLIVLSRLEGEIVGLATWKLWDEFVASGGPPILAQSLAIADPDAPPGSGSAITELACSSRPLGVRFIEYATQTRNLAVSNLVARQFSLSLARTGHVLHLWNDGAG